MSLTEIFRKAPKNLFDGIQVWDADAKQRATEKYLAAQPAKVIFPRGIPRRRPVNRYIHSTCGCWQCGFCENVIFRRALQYVRKITWEANR